jgi:hypothetical protein
MRSVAVDVRKARNQVSCVICNSESEPVVVVAERLDGVHVVSALVGAQPPAGEAQAGSAVQASQRCHPESMSVSEGDVGCTHSCCEVEDALGGVDSTDSSLMGDQKVSNHSDTLVGDELPSPLGDTQVIFPGDDKSIQAGGVLADVPGLSPLVVSCAVHLSTHSRDSVKYIESVGNVI